MTLDEKLQMINCYKAAAALAQRVSEEMLGRLAWIDFAPKVILDVGCGASENVEELKKRYSAAKVMALDHTHSMLKLGLPQATNATKICADTAYLPLKNHSVDFIFANCLLPWCQDFRLVLKEWRRVLCPQGLLLFSSLGPDTLKIWRDVLGDATWPNLIDMHEIGDELTKLRFAEPVMDVDYFTLTYRSISQFFAEMQASQMLVPAVYDHLFAQLGVEKRIAEIYPAEFEVVFGHAWGPHPKVDQVVDNDGIVNIPLSQLRGLRNRENC